MFISGNSVEIEKQPPLLRTGFVFTQKILISRPSPEKKFINLITEKR